LVDVNKVRSLSQMRHCKERNTIYKLIMKCQATTFCQLIEFKKNVSGAE